ncbi:uncharacterized protein PgNI_03031 [Pyricularia grisea]|uniref:Uncharacterized protein n=1 Tax=Pyricularia grisea TaxID=148305 RepID=A0A6P8B947_PYRGI|nr:uncharacterized protein PgNI_03031 [Pyricularia grisea]TLD12365.1 hypothetical protein PgNI_03031 [Pyricularia grisea]
MFQPCSHSDFLISRSSRSRDTVGRNLISHFCPCATSPARLALLATAITRAVFASGVLDDNPSLPQTETYHCYHPEKFPVCLEMEFWSRTMIYSGLSRSQPPTSNLQRLYRVAETINQRQKRAVTVSSLAVSPSFVACPLRCRAMIFPTLASTALASQPIIHQTHQTEFSKSHCSPLQPIWTKL